MVERSYRVGGDLYELQEEARRRGQGERPQSSYSGFRPVFVPPFPGQSEGRREEERNRDVWASDLRYQENPARRFEPEPARPFEEDRFQPSEESGSGGSKGRSENLFTDLFDKLHLKTEDLILIGLAIFLIYCDADWDIIVILGILFFVGWHT